MGRGGAVRGKGQVGLQLSDSDLVILWVFALQSDIVGCPVPLLYVSFCVLFHKRVGFVFFNE